MTDKKQQDVGSTNEQRLIMMMRNTGFTDREVAKLKKTTQADHSLLYAVYSLDVLYYRIITIFLFIAIFCSLPFYNAKDYADIISAIIVSCIAFAIFYYVCSPKIVFKAHRLVQRYQRELHIMTVGYPPPGDREEVSTKQAPLVIDPTNERLLINAMLNNGFTAKEVVLLQQNAKQSDSSLLGELHRLGNIYSKIIAPFLFVLSLCVTPFFFIKEFDNLIGVIITSCIALSITYFISTPILVYKSHRLLHRYHL